jgi:phosphosulfolactate phosphohydrolase-like enzyme
MNFRDKLAGEIEDPVVAGALENFKASVDAWSEAAYSRPRKAVKTARHSWRLAASWALGCVLAAGSLAGSLYERHQQQELARIAAEKAAQKAAQGLAPAKQSAAETVTDKRPTAAMNANGGDEDLLATVDSDVSRVVPAAMDPLAQLMNENGNE